MLIGNNNSVNLKLVDEISSVAPMQLVEYSELVANPEGFSAENPTIAIVNLMDLGHVEADLLALLKNNFPNLNIIAIHSFQSEHLIAKTLEKGYDEYVSIFDISDKMYSLLSNLSIH